MIIFWNGNTVSVEKRSDCQLFDRAFHFGDGIYETIAVKNSSPIFLYEHMKRLFVDADRINIPISNDINEWLDNINLVVNSNKFSEGFIKVIVTRGTLQYAGLSYPEPINPSIFIWGQECSFTRVKDKKPFKILVSQNERRNYYSLVTFVKTLNYLSNIIAKHEADERGCDEAIFLNIDGNISEGTTSNIFLINQENKLITPEVSSGLLDGVVRSKVIDTALSQGIDVETRAVNPDELKSAKGCFLTSSLIGITPVEEVVGYPKYNVSEFIDLLEIIDDKYESLINSKE